MSKGVYFDIDYLPHALKSWLKEEESNPSGPRRNYVVRVSEIVVVFLSPD
jgi:hypothetical protein